jgi:hypothetical protein
MQTTEYYILKLKIILRSFENYIKKSNLENAGTSNIYVKRSTF